MGHPRWMLETVMAAALLAACDRPAPSRIVTGTNDTVVVYHRRSIRLPVRALNPKGGVVTLPFDYSTTDTALVRVTAVGDIACLRSGDALVRISTAGLSSTVTVLCRPLYALQVGRSLLLRLGDPPLPLSFSASGEDGRPIYPLSASVTVADTTIAVVRDGQVYPKQPGRTQIELAVGLCRTVLFVQVLARASSSNAMPPGSIFEDSIRMDPGESRSWRVGVGDYGIRVAGFEDRPGSLAFTFDPPGCTAQPTESAYYYCRFQQPGTFTVRHNARGGAGQTTFRLSVLRGWERGPRDVSGSPAQRGTCSGD